MLKKIAVALVAASVFAAPVLAQTGSTGTQAPAAKPAAAAPAAPSKVTAPTKSVRHVKKVRHTRSRCVAVSTRRSPVSTASIARVMD